MTSYNEFGISVTRVAELVHRLRTAEDLETLTTAVADYGWSVPLALIAVLGVVSGVFEYLTNPYVVAEGYVFPGWIAPLFVNLVYGVALTGFAWFLFFGVIGSFAGYLSDVRKMDTAVFKIGSYFLLVLVPVLLVGWLLALTLTVPESATFPTEVTREGVNPGDVTAYSVLHDTVQLHVVRVLRAAAWVVIGFLMLPVVEHRFELSRKESVLAVLPVTLVAVFATQLV